MVLGDGSVYGTVPSSCISRDTAGVLFAAAVLMPG